MPSGGGWRCSRSRRAPNFPKLDRWVGDLGAHGVIEYTVHGGVVRVVVWRIQYVG